MRETTRAVFAAGLLLAACASTEDELQQVAKDWCLTIRASQVLPVYPLSEDVQPGDVFLVPVPLAKQADVWEERGFLPLDQHVARLTDLPYADFYSDDYFKAKYAGVPHDRPGPWGEGPVMAPRAAFPSYTFLVEKSAGFKLALPLQGVPVGLGILGAQQARGSVALKDAYTYGVEGAALVEKLVTWWKATPGVRRTLRTLAGATPEDLYLRVVTRVYLVGEVAVSVTNLDSSGADVAAGAAPEVDLVRLATKDPKAAEAAADAMTSVLAKLSAAAGDAAGGRLKLVQASSRSVTLNEKFDRPLVIGYVGFDVRIRKDGTLSAPIPSFSVVTGRTAPEAFVQSQGYQADVLGESYAEFIDVPQQRDLVDEWLKGRKADADPSELVDSPDPKHRELLREADLQFHFAPAKE